MTNNTMMEIYKPSELSQILFVKNNNATDKLDFAKITPVQIDLINCLYYYARESMIKNEIILSESGATPFTIPLHRFSNDLNKYKGHEYNKIIDDLNAISDIKIVINSLGKNKDEEEMTITRFILEMSISKHKINTGKKSTTILLSNKLIQKFINVKKCFAKMFLKIQFSMTSKYSKLLYEILKDYENINEIVLDVDMVVMLLNDTNFKEWSIFRANVLDRAVKEINEKSDIKVSYEAIKEKVDDQRKQVTKIKFIIQKQPEFRLQQLGLMEQTIESHRFYHKSKTKLDALVKNGYQVIDEEMWIKTDINKNETKYEAETRIDAWLTNTEKEDKNRVFEYLATQLDDCDDPIVSIENYTVKGVFSKDVFTSNASETINLLNTIIEEMSDDHNFYN